MTNLTEAQKLIITTNQPHVLVSSSAAAGKTTCLIERIQYLLNSGVNPSEIVAITFTNNAAAEMLKRLGNPEGIFISTIHSYCNYLLRGNAIDTNQIIQEERFDDLFEEIKKNPQCIKHVTHLISDESQDVSREQFEFYEMIHPDNYMYFYDIKQTLYEWRGADPNYLITLSKQPDVVTYTMNQNFRNTPSILRFAKKFLYTLGPDYEDDSIAARTNIKSNYGVMDITASPSEALEALIHIHDSLHTKWGEWFILCRTNEDITLFQLWCNKWDIPNVTFKQGDLTGAEIEGKMNEDVIKILTVHSAKGLETPYVLAYNLWAYNNEQSRICYVAATRAKDFLIWAKLPKKNKRKKKDIVTWE